jgi:glycine hydroxymethyltransferase
LIYTFLSAQAQTENFKVYQQQVVNNARTLAAALANKGYGIVSGGTDTHVVLLDLRAKV